MNDAIDSDFSSLTITNSEFKNIGNDGVDGSGSNIIINKGLRRNRIERSNTRFLSTTLLINLWFLAAN